MKIYICGTCNKEKPEATLYTYGLDSRPPICKDCRFILMRKIKSDKEKRAKKCIK